MLLLNAFFKVLIQETFISFTFTKILGSLNISNSAKLDPFNILVIINLLSNLFSIRLYF